MSKLGGIQKCLKATLKKEALFAAWLKQHKWEEDIDVPYSRANGMMARWFFKTKE